MLGATRELQCEGQQVLLGYSIGVKADPPLPCSRGLGNLFNPLRAWDRGLQLSLVNEEFLVMAVHQTVMNTFLPFVHTARRFYRLNDPVNSLEPVQISAQVKLCKPYHLEEGEVVTRFP